MKERLENLAQWSSMPLKFRPSDMSYAPKTHVPQAVPLMNKQWQQQQVGSDFFDTSKRPPRVPSEDDDDDDDEESVDPGHIPKKENLHQKCDTSQKLEGKGNDFRGNTPRSKHSATEQRRRSKINDRFQMLRQLVANSDQKRDKASFLLEVIDYIQMLQEKLRKYEAADHGRQQETLKTIPWDVFQRNPGCRESPADAPRVPSVPNVSFESKQVPDSNGYVMPRSNESEVSGPELRRGIGQVSTISDRSAQIPQAHHSSYENKATICKPVAVTLSAQPPALPTFGSCSTHVFHSVPQATTEAHPMFSQLHYHEEQAVSLFSEAKGSLYNKVEAASLPQLHGNNLVSPQNMNNVTELEHEKAKISEQSVQKLNRGNSDEELKYVKSTQGQHPTEKTSFLREGEKDGHSSAHDIDDSKAEQKCEVQADEQEPLIIQGGVISVSSLYSQGLLDTLTRALQSSGLDLRQATISVQIDLGNPSGSAVASSRKTAMISTGISHRPNGEAGTSLESEHPSKKPKIEG